MIVIANILQPLIDVSEAILKFFHDQVGFGWGLSIVGMTIVIRLAILPLTFKGAKGMQEMKRLQPEMKRIQERYKDDRQRMQQETMKLYQEHQVNPLSSCLPILLQLPFFIALFYLLRGPEFRADIQGAEQFLFIPDLGVAPTGAPLVALIVLYVVTQLAASLVTLISADKNQRRIFLALPFLFVLFIINFPAGLIVYWITTNVWTVGQQLVVKRLYPELEPVQGKDEQAKPARGKPTPRPALADGSDGASSQEGGGRRSGRRAASSASDSPSTKGNGAQRSSPPPSPRKKKKRSGRRR
jgi:YidC/Oxa1 family membrane protein insertase